MAYPAPARSARWRLPNFASGYAIRESSQGGRQYWDQLVAAFVPFLGPVNNPATLLFGNAVKSGTNSFSGGQCYQDGDSGGWAWRFTTVNDNVILANQSDELNATKSVFTYVIGFRKTDSTVRDGMLVGSDFGNFGSNTAFVRLRSGSATPGIAFNVVGTAANLDPGTNFSSNLNFQEYHVLTARYGFGTVGNLSVFVDGQLINSSSGSTFSGALSGTLGVGKNNSGTFGSDLIDIAFVYVFNRALPHMQVVELSLDPGMLFRPVQSAVTKKAVVFNDLAASLTSGNTLSGTLTEPQLLAAALSSGNTLSGTLTEPDLMTAALSSGSAVSATLTEAQILAAGLTFGSELVGTLNSEPVSQTEGGLGGAGAEAAGDPIGGGGPIHLIRAIPVEGQTVRAVFDEEPLHQSPASTGDALNPSNYAFTILDGTGTAPAAVGVKQVIVVGPAAGPVNSGEYGVDVQTDRPLVLGLTYQIIVNPRLQAASGGSLGYPYNASFPGAVKLQAAVPQPLRLTNLDLGLNLFTGAYIFDDSGDVAPQGGLEGLRQRIIRRLMTPKNTFAFLPGYGLLPKLKNPASIREILQLKADAVQQIGSEPEVANVDVQVSFSNNVLQLSVKAQTKTGLVLSTSISINTVTGKIVVT